MLVAFSKRDSEVEIVEDFLCHLFSLLSLLSMAEITVLSADSICFAKEIACDSV